METKIKRLRRWACSVVCPEPKPSESVCVIHRIDDHTLETLKHQGYDVEIEVYDDRRVRVSAFLKGRRCLDGWFETNGDWAWSYIIETDHVPEYSVREYLKQQALQRIKE